MLEARDRPGGRVEAVPLPDGRIVQAGGEVFGHGHHAYRELAGELGLTIEPQLCRRTGRDELGSFDGVYVGDEPPWMSEEERDDADRVDARIRAPDRHGGSGRSVGPSVAAAYLDAHQSRGVVALDQAALPGVHRRHTLASLSLACDGPERTSLLAELRKHARLRGGGFYDLRPGRACAVAEGSAAVVVRMAAELAPPAAAQRPDRGRESEPRRGGVRIELKGGETDAPPRRSSARFRQARCGRSRSRGLAKLGCDRFAHNVTPSPRRWS